MEHRSSRTALLAAGTASVIATGGVLVSTPAHGASETRPATSTAHIRGAAHSCEHAGHADSGVQRMHELHMQGNPGMQRMHELHMQGCPGTQRMHQLHCE
jgi:hypothetical protein